MLAVDLMFSKQNRTAVEILLADDRAKGNNDDFGWPSLYR